MNEGRRVRHGTQLPEILLNVYSHGEVPESFHSNPSCRDHHCPVKQQSHANQLSRPAPYRGIPCHFLIQKIACTEPLNMFVDATETRYLPVRSKGKAPPPCPK